MSSELFLRGLAIGFAVAFALGPIGLLVIRRTIDRGWAYGFLSGGGVATADATYGAIAAFGLTAVSQVLVGIDRPLGIIGGAVLLVLGWQAVRLGRWMLGRRTEAVAD
jgi:threonine/homoserine/homoserine lactone efflux protein